MQKTVIQKLRSDKGASILIALLLFLVCAAVGAVILTAATAAAGRVSDLSEMDQRYYSVSSAAELLAKQLCEKEVTIQSKRTVTTETDLTFDGTTVTEAAPRTTTTYATEVNGRTLEIALNDPSFLSTRALKLLFGDDPSSTANSEAAMGYSFSHSGEQGTLSIEHTSFQELTISNIQWEVLQDGSLSFNIEQDNYAIVLLLVPEIGEHTETQVAAPETSSSGSGYTREETTTTVKTSTIQWKVGSIRKEVSQPNESSSGNG